MARRPKQLHAGALTSGAPASSPDRGDTAALVAKLHDLDLAALSLCWRNHLGGTVPVHLPRWLLTRVLAYRLQAVVRGDLDKASLRRLRLSTGDPEGAAPFTARAPSTRDGATLKAGALLVREWKGQMQHVMVVDEGFAWNGTTHTSLSRVAKAITGTNWNGHRFFGLKKAHNAQ
jgi:hypothetical protein